MHFSRMPVTGVVGASRPPAPRTADLLPLRAPPPSWGPPPLFLCIPSPATRSRWEGGSGHRQPCHAWSQTGQKDRKSQFPTLRRCPTLPCLPRARTRCAPARGDAPAGTQTPARGGGARGQVGGAQRPRPRPAPPAGGWAPRLPGLHPLLGEGGLGTQPPAVGKLCISGAVTFLGSGPEETASQPRIGAAFPGGTFALKGVVFVTGCGRASDKNTCPL